MIMKNAIGSPRTKTIILILACLIFAVAAYFWITALVNSYYSYQSPLHSNPPAPGEMLGKPATRQIVFVLIDALRYDTSLKTDVMPNLNQLRQAGASARMHSQTPSFSEPGYSTLLTGGWPYLNDGPVFNIDYDNIPTWTQDNLFSAAQRAGLKTAVSGYYWFEKLIPQTAVTASFYTPGEDDQADRDVMAAALPWIRRGEYSLVLVHLDQVDYAGHHQGGPRSANWAAAAKRTDDMLAEILASIDLTKDTVLVLSDHGQVDAGGHGGQDPVTLVEPFVIAGAGVTPGQYGEIQMIDVAPTLAALLGVNLPASAQGTAQTAMLALPAETLTALQQAQPAQQKNLTASYNEAIGQGGSTSIDAARAARLAGERWPRAILAGLVLLIPAGFMLRRRSPALAGLLGAAVLTHLIFHLRYGVIDGKVYSFSAITSPTALILYVAVTSAIALVFGWLLLGWKSKLWKANPLEAANTTLGFVWMVLYLASFPILWNYAVNGLTLTWTTPAPFTSYFGVLILAQALSMAAEGLILAGISALVVFLIQRKQAPVSAPAA
jgi:hypothetical protein